MFPVWRRRRKKKLSAHYKDICCLWNPKYSIWKDILKPFPTLSIIWKNSACLCTVHVNLQCSCTMWHEKLFFHYLSVCTHNAAPWNARRQDDPGHPLGWLHSLASKPALTPWTAAPTPPATALSGSSPQCHRQPTVTKKILFFNIQGNTCLIC